MSPGRTPRRKDVARARSIDALSDIRSRGLSIRDAAKANRTTPRTIQKYLPKALKRGRRGRIVATASDRYARRVNVLTENGIQAVGVPGSRAAGRVARHRQAVDRYLKTGDTTLLKPFQGKSFKAGKTSFPFITDEKTLKRLGHASDIAFVELYASVS